MYKVEITECSLRTGYNARFDSYHSALYEAEERVAQFLADRHIDIAKFYSRHRSLVRGTVEGIKLFWSPASGIRYYLFINILEEKRLA
jgi:hypothetical protein